MNNKEPALLTPGRAEPDQNRHLSFTTVLKLREKDAWLCACPRCGRVLTCNSMVCSCICGRVAS